MTGGSILILTCRTTCRNITEDMEIVLNHDPQELNSFELSSSVIIFLEWFVR